MKVLMMIAQSFLRIAYRSPVIPRATNVKILYELRTLKLKVLAFCKFVSWVDDPLDITLAIPDL